MGNVIGHRLGAFVLSYWNFMVGSITMSQSANQTSTLKGEEKLTTGYNITNDGTCHVKGLPNIGSTCYLNVIIQSLSWTPCFRMLLEKMSLKDVKNKFKLTQSLHSVLRQLREETSIHKQSKSLKKFLKVVGRKNSQFNGFSQQDGYEVFNTIISEIDGEVQNTYKTPINCVSVSRLFSGVFLTKYQYSGCKHVDVYFQHFTSMSIPVIEPKEENLTQRPIKRQRVKDNKEEMIEHTKRETFKRSVSDTYEQMSVKLEFTAQAEHDQQFIEPSDQVKLENSAKHLLNALPENVNSDIHSQTQSSHLVNIDDAPAFQNPPSKFKTKDDVAIEIPEDNVQNDSPHKQTTNVPADNHYKADFSPALPLSKKGFVYANDFISDKLDVNCRDQELSLNKCCDVQSNDPLNKEKKEPEVELSKPDELITNEKQIIRSTTGGYMPVEYFSTKRRKRKLNQDEPLTDIEQGLKCLMKAEEHDGGLFTCRQCLDKKDLKELDIMDKEAFQVWTDSHHVSPMKYRLFSVVCHKGSVNAGHYHTYIRKTTEDINKFNRLNALVEQNVLSEQDMTNIKKYFQSQTRDKLFTKSVDISEKKLDENADWYYFSDLCALQTNCKEALNSGNAYMLFYERL